MTTIPDWAIANAPTVILYDDETGERLDGAASAELIAAAYASPTDVVCAYRDDDGAWLPVPASEVGLREIQGHTVRAVYVHIE